MTGKRRFTAIFITVIFLLSTCFAASFSYATGDNQQKEQTKKTQETKQNQKSENGQKKETKSRETKKSDTKKTAAKKSAVVKDTSWFDYENPQKSYKITTEAQLMGLASLVNEEQQDSWKPTRVENFQGVTFTLTKDIELTQEWTPIGINSAAYFAGSFDGNGHTISNLCIDNTAGNCGLFGYLTGEVRNLTVEGTITSLDGNCGGVAGQISESGRIINCTSDVKINAKHKTGGITGYNDGGMIEGCINKGTVSGTYKVGGIAGENWGGKITASGNHGKIKSSRRGVATYGTGGIAGRSVSAEAEISECYNIGEIVSNTEATGGVAGYMNAKGTTVKDCYNTGKIQISQESDSKNIVKTYAGGITGIAGVNGVVIRNCYNAGEIKGADVTGGIIGRYINATDKETEKYIRNNYYLNEYFNSGIGVVEDKNDPNLEDAASGVSKGSLSSLSSSLSVSYMKGSISYGNGGYPALKWQEPVTEEEKVYLSGISKQTQKKLDEYLVKNAGKVQYGQSVLDFFTPDNVTNDAMILYMEAQENEEERAQE